VPNLLDQLREQRDSARSGSDEILTRAASEGRDLTPEELATYQTQVTAEREANDAIEREHARQLAEVRAMATRRNGPTLTDSAGEFRLLVGAGSAGRVGRSSFRSLRPR
jgi:hypothetical protein